MQELCQAYDLEVEPDDHVVQKTLNGAFAVLAPANIDWTSLKYLKKKDKSDKLE